MADAVQIFVVSNRFRAIAGEVSGRINDALDTAMLTIVAVADPLTRVDTGALRANKTLRRDGNGATVTWIQDYAAHQNDGTRYMQGTHYANTGMDAATPPFLAALAKLGG